MIMGGANGSRKTTFAREIVAQTRIEYLGADEIAAELNPAAPETVQWRKSQDIKAYLEGYETKLIKVKSEINPDSPEAHWLEWARGCAAQLDPLNNEFGDF